jgi:hypothetical protein
MDTTLEPKLAPPGAGLPKAELFIARRMFAWRRKTRSREQLTVDFQEGREAIAAMVRTCDAEVASRRVLIERPRGLEDSSRYWSVWMTLDHLRIVHGGINRTIDALTKGVVVEGAASTAAVKPSPDVKEEVVAAYEKSCDDLLATVAAVKDLNTSLQYTHPWFGPLNAAGWHAMAAGHLEIHRVQIERILQGLHVST